MNLYIQWEEVLWTLVAFVGLGYALYNGREARSDLRAAIRRQAPKAELLWAQFSRLLHITLAAVETAFVLVGVLAMFRRPSPDTEAFGRLLLLVLLVGGSVLLTSVSIMWQRVNATIFDALKGGKP